MSGANHPTSGDGPRQLPGVADDVVPPSPPAALGSVGGGFGSKVGLLSTLEPQPAVTAIPASSRVVPSVRRIMVQSSPLVFKDYVGSTSSGPAPPHDAGRARTEF